jgi:CubicO group peptidase (beta-lactamase class C family)
VTSGASEHYFPGPDSEWERRDAADLGMDAAALAEAVAFAEANETRWPLDVSRMVGRGEKPPHNEILGPTKERGPTSGLVLRQGHIVAQWGDPARIDMTFSATKSYLSTVAGLAFDRGLIRDTGDLVRDYVDDGGFDPPHNSAIRWEHLLQQTSEWEGTLFDKPDLIDRNRSVGVDTGLEKGTFRELQEPGTHYEYNDVRVNRLGLCLLRLWGEPSPAVLKRELMDPIGASDSWLWHGYRNSWVDVNGELMQSVPGGAHWGGGLWISTFDHARFGYLLMRRGCWGDRQVLSEGWIDRATTPSEANPAYGYMWWLNTGGNRFSGASESTFSASGAGGNEVVIDPERELVITVRWGGDNRGVVERVMAALA